MRKGEGVGILKNVQRRNIFAVNAPPPSLESIDYWQMYNREMIDGLSIYIETEYEDLERGSN